MMHDSASSEHMAHTTPTALRPAVGWWYTLAHEETMPAGLTVTVAALSEFTEALTSAGAVEAAALVAQIAREVRRDETASAQAGAGRADGGGVRYVWAFRRLGDALTALRANHRSDYHAYPQPRSLREASLNRLYQRFPLDDYPRTTALLFTGMRVCDDPRLWADPRADTLVSAAPGAVAPEDWRRYTLCGFRQGVALVRVGASSRWLRIGASALEDAWALARDTAEVAAGQRNVSAVKLTEALARDALLASAPAESFLRLDDAAGLAPASAEPTAVRPLDRMARSPQPLTPTTGKRASVATRRPAV